MSLIRFGGSRELSVVVGLPTGLHSGAGLHRLTFPVAFDNRRSTSGAVTLEVRGEAWLGPGGGDWLGTVQSVQALVVSELGPFDGILRVALTDEQLAVVEQRRAGGDIQFQLDLWLTLGYDPSTAQGSDDERWPSKTVQETVHVQRGVWAQLLEQVRAGSSLAVVLPVPLGRSSTSTQVGEHLRKALRKLNSGDYVDAVVAARRALDVIDGRWPSAREVIDVPQRDRSLEQRLGLLRAALASLAGPAPHGDPVATSITWTRENAMAVIASVAALAACIA